jgi:hypothetical protein
VARPVAPSAGSHGRRDASGVAVFLLFGALAVTLLALQLIR